MIRISGTIMDAETLINLFSSGNTERKIIGILASSYNVYDYLSLNQLKFELDLRLNIIRAAIELNQSNFSFKTFRKSICNTAFWDRTDEGGFTLKPGQSPSNAINDIYRNSSKYGTECATAIVIIYYKALLGVYPRELYDRLFQRIYLMNWQHLDKNMGIVHYRHLPDYLPGDCRYFKNPEVDPLTTEWQGENVIDLDSVMYYGHGIGIGTSDQIIRELNKHRIPGSSVSAYLMDSATRLNFNLLAKIYFDHLL